MSLIAFALAAAALSGAPADPAAENEADIRCVAVIASVIGSGKVEGEARAGLFGGVMFFVGRIEGRDPDYDLKGGMLRLAARSDYMTILNGERQRCAQIMTERGQLMTDLGNQLTAAGH